MTWQLTDDLNVFATAVKPLLDAQPERYTVLATVLDGLLMHGPNLYGADPLLLTRWARDGVVQAAALQTPPHALLVTELPGDSAGELAALLATGYADGRIRAPITRINGGEPDVTALAGQWRALTGLTYRVHMRQRLYRLGTLTPPDPMPNGTARVATRADEDLVHAWIEAFFAEAQPGAAHASHDIRLGEGLLVLWMLGQTPVSMAGRTAAIAGVARIAPVYTPPELRHRRYGAAATVAATRLAIEDGASKVVLFTNLANPVSNALYIKLGYQAVEDKVILAIERS